MFPWEECSSNHHIQSQGFPHSCNSVLSFLCFTLPETLSPPSAPAPYTNKTAINFVYKVEKRVGRCSVGKVFVQWDLNVNLPSHMNPGIVVCLRQQCTYGKIGSVKNFLEAPNPALLACALGSIEEPLGQMRWKVILWTMHTCWRGMCTHSH